MIIRDGTKRALAELHGKQAGLVFPTGYGSNDATIQCLLQLIPNMLVLSDANNHASIINGIRSSKARCKIFKHNDVDDLERLLAEEPWNRPKIVVFESVYSMDGDVAPIRRIAEVAKAHNAMTYLDEVHAIGMYGPPALSSPPPCRHRPLRPVCTTCATYSVSRLIGFVHSEGRPRQRLPWANAFGCPAEFNLTRHALMASDTEREALHQKTQMLRDVLLTHSIPVMAQSTTHILPIRVGDAIKCKKAARRLLEHHKVYLQPINSPTVAVGTERFRVNVTPTAFRL